MKPVRVLFVCMGNICRSPAAEAVMKHLIKARGLHDKIIVDSAGTLNYHSGEPSDWRMREAGTRRGYAFDHLARQVRPTDFHDFDYIAAMDRDNLQDMAPFIPKTAERSRIALLLEHSRDGKGHEVPDPYYGGPDGFEHVMNLVEEGCQALLERIVREHALE